MADPIKHFVREALGCTCAEEVFRNISIDVLSGSGYVTLDFSL
jgi:hypothetical protein